MPNVKRQYDREGFPLMTPRERELEALLYRLRRLVYDTDERRVMKAERLICNVKWRLKPYWEARSAVVKQRAGDRFMRLWE